MGRRLLRPLLRLHLQRLHLLRLLLRLRPRLLLRLLLRLLHPECNYIPECNCIRIFV